MLKHKVKTFTLPPPIRQFSSQWSFQSLTWAKKVSKVKYNDLLEKATFHKKSHTLDFKRDVLR